MSETITVTPTTSIFGSIHTCKQTRNQTNTVGSNQQIIVFLERVCVFIINIWNGLSTFIYTACVIPKENSSGSVSLKNRNSIKTIIVQYGCGLCGKAGVC